MPKSPVHTGTTDVGGWTFVSRPSRSTSHPAARCHVFLCQLLNLTGGCQNSPCRAGRCTCPRLSITFRLRGGGLAFVPKSPVHTGTTDFGGYPFVSRPSRSTFHPAARCHVVLCQLLNLTGGSQNSPRRGGPLRPPAVTFLQGARGVDVPRSCLCRRTICLSVAICVLGYALRPAHSTFHPASRCHVFSVPVLESNCWIPQNSPCRGWPLHHPVLGELTSM